MRLLIFFILLSLGADAQIIRANAFYRPLVCQGLLLDCYPSSLGYSLRKIRTGYTGNAIRIRRDSTGNAETDIGFLSNGNLDTNAIKIHCRNNSCFVTTWYDQTTNGLNATQTTAANQPRIVNSGVIDREGNNVIVRFDGSNDFLTHSAISAGLHRELFYVSKNRDTIGAQVIYEHSTNYTSVNNSFVINLEINNSFYRTVLGQRTTASNYNVRQTLASGNTNQAFQLSNYKFDRSVNNNTLQGRLWVNGSERTTEFQSIFTSNQFNVNYSASPGFIGNRSGSTTSGAKLNLTELIIYNTDQSSNRTGIETNINNYYGIW